MPAFARHRSKRYSDAIACLLPHLWHLLRVDLFFLRLRGQTTTTVGDQGQRSNAALSAAQFANHWLYTRDVGFESTRDPKLLPSDALWHESSGWVAGPWLYGVVNTTACKRPFSLGCVPHTDGAVFQEASSPKASASRGGKPNA